MTIALTIRISNALILATDSSSTIMEIENDIPHVHQTYFNADKLFNLKKNEPIGCLTWGDGSINGIPISSLTKDFRDELKIDELNIENIAKEFIEFLEKNIGDSNNINIGFLIAGYPDGEGNNPEMYVIEIKQGKIQEKVKLTNDSFSISWFGDYDFLSRFIFGIDSNMGNMLKENGFDEDEVDEIIEFSKRELALPLGFSEMPIQDAIDLAKFLVDICKKSSRFIPGPQVIGGPTDIAVITKHEGFKWIERKHYYSQELNIIEHK